MKINEQSGSAAECQHYRLLKIIFNLIISAGIFSLLLGLLYIPRIINSDKIYKNEWYETSVSERHPVIIPFMKKLKHDTTFTVHSITGPVKNKCLCFWDLNATAVSACFNGESIYHIAEKSNPTANIWNNFIVIRLPDSSESSNTVTLELTGTQLISMGRRPFLLSTETAVRNESLYTILMNDLLIAVMGGCVMLGILLILLSRHSDYNHIEGFLLGVTCFFITVYCFDFTYRTSTGSYIFYTILKRIIIAAAATGTYGYFAAIDHKANGYFKTSRWCWIPILVTLIYVLVSPSMSVLYARSMYVMIIVLLHFIGIIVIVFYHKELSYKPLYVISSGLTAMCITQLLLIMTIMPNLPSVLQFTSLITVIFCCVEFLMDYRKVLMERELFRNEYNRDSLTNAYNRRILSDIPEGLFASAAFLDMDQFKQYNDSYGHKEGDRILRELVNSANQSLRKEDLIVRYGGDEFIILMKENDITSAAKIIERIRDNFRRSVNLPEVDFSYGLSIIGDSGTLDIAELSIVSKKNNALFLRFFHFLLKFRIIYCRLEKYREVYAAQ